jgi:hypothetical protein
MCAYIYYAICLVICNMQTKGGKGGGRGSSCELVGVGGGGGGRV